MVRKYVGSILFLCLLIGITIYVLIENNDMRAVAAAMARAEHIWIFAGILAGCPPVADGVIPEKKNPINDQLIHFSNGIFRPIARSR